jgi:hypothetical protein
VEFGNTFPVLATKNDIIEGDVSFYVGLIIAMIFATRGISILVLRETSKL